MSPEAAIMFIVKSSRQTHCNSSPGRPDERRTAPNGC